MQIFQFEIIQKKKGAFDLENKGFQKILFSKFALILPRFSKTRSTLDFKSFATHPPSLFKHNFKTT
jgi:hypothetical protein